MAIDGWSYEDRLFRGTEAEQSIKRKCVVCGFYVLERGLGTMPDDVRRWVVGSGEIGRALRFESEFLIIAPGIIAKVDVKSVMEHTGNMSFRVDCHDAHMAEAALMPILYAYQDGRAIFVSDADACKRGPRDGSNSRGSKHPFYLIDLGYLEPLEGLLDSIKRGDDRWRPSPPPPETLRIWA